MKLPAVPILLLELLLVSVSSGSSPSALITTEGPAYTCRLWQTGDGLSQDDVQALCQTKDGYVYVGTQSGIARFDGLRFTPLDSTAMVEGKNRSRTLLCAGNDSSLWAATENGKLRCWKDGNVSELSLPEPFTNAALTTIFSGRDNSLWIGSDREGLLHFKNGHFARWSTKEGLAHPSVRSIFEDAEGTIWIATGAGVNRLQGDTVTRLTIEDGLPHNSIRAVCADKKGNLWVASNFGLTRWKNGAATHFRKEHGLADNLISVIFEDHRGTIWVGTLNGLNRFSDGKWLTEKRDDGTSYDRVNCITEDREGNLWIGGRDGLSRLTSRAVTSLTQQQGLTHNSVTFVFQDHDGNSWAGFWGGGVNRIEGSKVTAYTKRDGLSSDLVLTMHETRQGDLWFGMDYDGGLTLLRKDRFLHFGARNGLKDQGVKVLQEDSDGNLWVGTRTALLRFNDGKFTRFTTRDGLPSNTIEAIHEDRDHHLWFGTTGGLALWQTNHFKSFTKKDGLSHNSVTAIYEDRSGVLWLGTRGGGLTRLVLSPATEPEENSLPRVAFTALTSVAGLFSDQVSAVVEDELGFLWMASPQGIFRVRKKDLDDFVPEKGGHVGCVSFGRADGMTSVQCKGSDKTAACKTRDGRLWFATAKGIAIIDPRNISMNDAKPPVFIEEVIVDKNHVQGSTETTNLKVAPNHGELEFHYTALSFRQPEKNRFKYKLEGVDADWVDAETRRVAYYNNIGPGSYRFRVTGCNNDGVWNEAGAELAFVLMPHFWQTWWFKSSIAAAIAVIVIGIYRLRIARLREIEKLRLRIAADLHDEVGSTVGSIAVLSEMLRDFGELGPQETKDITKINQLSMQTAISIREIVWFINPEYDTLHELLLRMKDVADNLLSGMSYRMETPKDNLSRRLPLEFRQNFFLIYKEALANVMKHSKASCVEIQISENRGEWHLSIQDNGVGIDSNVVTKGNGLKNLRRRAEKLNGTLDITSQYGQGTMIQFACRLNL